MGQPADLPAKQTCAEVWERRRRRLRQLCQRRSCRATGARLCRTAWLMTAYTTARWWRLCAPCLLH